MNILTVDTSSKMLKVALSNEKKVVSKIEEEGLIHCERLVPAIQEVLSKVHISLDDLDGLGVCLGPGSFTGLRIGISTIKGIAYVKEIPVVGTISLDLLTRKAEDRTNKDIICPIIDAKRGLLYSSLYKRRKRITDYELVSPEGLVERIKTGVFFVGDGILKYGSYLKKNIEGTEFANEELWYPDVEFLSRMSMEKLRRKETIDAMGLVPFYIYERDVQVRKKGQTGPLPSRVKRRGDFKAKRR